ncbi:MAG: xylulokinase [Caldilineaceae bacterium]
MSTTFVLAHDLGTTGNKATLFDGDGKLVGSAFMGYPTYYPRPNWAEQDPAAWWEAVCTTTRQLLEQTGIPATAIAAVGLCGQMMGCTPVDGQGRPLRSCIIWADQRAQQQAEEIAARCGAEAVYQRSGHRPSPAYTAAKILWLREEEPALFAQTAAFLQPKDTIAHQLTGALVTDYSDASGTLLFDLATRTWAPEFLTALQLSAESLPTPQPSTAIIGEITARAADATGLAAGTPVVIGGGDGACAGVGAGVVEPGDAYCYIGSSAWISISTRQPILDPAQRTFTFHHLHPQRYAPMGTMQAAGGARDWVWQLLADPTLDLDEAAAAVTPGAGGLLFLPYLLGERSPHWNPLARGALVGLAMPHNKPQIARAVLEGVALNLRLILDALRSSIGASEPPIRAMRLIGGGGKSRLWPQILADCLQLPIQQLSLTGEATSWGAAMAAGVGVGLYDWSLAAQRASVSAVIEPTAHGSALYNELAAIYADAYTALDPIYTRLAALASA